MNAAAPTPAHVNAQKVAWPTSFQRGSIVATTRFGQEVARVSARAEGYRMLKTMLVWSAAFGALGAVGVFAGCGSDEGQPGGNDGGPSSDGPLTSDVPSISPDSGMCTTAAQCGGGVCVNGVCCSDAAHVCGSTCCSGGSVCLFGACVVPGMACQTSDQCAPGQYCEPALGGSDAGVPPPDSGCTQLASSGRCVQLPPTCVGDAGVGPDGGTCIEQCEYHQPPNGPLSAKEKWSWGATDPKGTDVWSTPTVGRMYDTNCDGTIDRNDSPVIVFIAGDVAQTCCGCNGATPSTCESGQLHMVNGADGKDLWTLTKASAASVGFMGSAPAIGDVDKDGVMDIVTMTGEGDVVLVDHLGNVKRKSDKPYPHTTALGAGQGTGWGGGLELADMDLDGFTEIAFGDTVWTTKNNAITRVFVGGQGTGGGANEETSAISDLDLAADGHLELVAGNTAYKSDGTVLWHDGNLPNGFPAVADFNVDGKPDVVVVGFPAGNTTQGAVWIVDGATGAIELGPTPLPYDNVHATHGGPPTVADFDGNGKPDIGVAGASYYAVLQPDYTGGTIKLLWSKQNHDYSSSVTGSTVFDFEGDGIAEVVYADECWLWVFDGPTGNVRLAYSHTSFTGTEASMLADIDGDGHAEMLIVSNGIDPSPSGWKCTPNETTPINGQLWTPGPRANKSYAGLVALGDTADSWVGTRTLWNEHTYHVSNICDDSDNACTGANVYGSLPTPEVKNWTVGYLNDFRQNVQDKGIFNAPDAIVGISVDCASPVMAHVSIRNIGAAGLPAGVTAGVFVTPGDVQVGTVTTTVPLLPGQTQTLDVTLMSPAMLSNTFYAKILIDPAHPTFHECRNDNDTSTNVMATCTR
jgi:hypothetical protein